MEGNSPQEKLRGTEMQRDCGFVCSLHIYIYMHLGCVCVVSYMGVSVGDAPPAMLPIAVFMLRCRREEQQRHLGSEICCK